MSTGIRQQGFEPPRNSPRLTRAWLGRTGVAAVEFATAAPVIILILVGVLDLGRATLLRMSLESDVAASCNYALVNASLVTGTGGASLASSLAKVMGGNLGQTLNNGTAIVDNGPTATVRNGVAALSGTASNADLCYCPTGTAAPWVWNSNVACGSTCPSGLLAGKFVTITETQTFVPLFSSYHLLPNNQLTVSEIMQVQ